VSSAYPCACLRVRGGDPKQAQDEAVSGCYMWIDQNSKKAMHECKLLGSVSHNLSISSKCALSLPCTNRPNKNCVSYFDESYERQRDNVHMCIGV